MKPNQLQQQQLRQYLGKNLKYRETYAEFYDHILAALEARPADTPFEDVAWKIINEDFGGIEGMRAIEDKYQFSIFREMKKKYLCYAAENFKPQWLAMTGIFAALVYYIVTQHWFSFLDFMLLLIGIRLIPAILQAKRQLKTIPAYGAPRRSIKSGFFTWVNYIPAIIMIGLISLMPGSFRNTDWIQAMNPVVMVVLFTLVAMHSVAFYKVYRDDIRTSFTVN